MACRDDEAVRFLKRVDRLLLNDIQQRKLGGLRSPVDEIHDFTLGWAGNAGVRVGRKIPDGRRVPMISAGEAARVVHALLHHRPLALGSNNERVEVDLKAVRNRVIVDSRRKPAGADQRFAIETAPFGDRS